MALDPHFMEMEWQNGFEATLDARVVLSDTYIPMTPVPEGDFGRLVLEDTSKENFEIIRYNRKDAAGVFVETGDGGLRNEDGSSSGVHPRGARIRGNITAQDIREMRAAAKAAVDEFQAFTVNLPDWRPIVAVPTVQSIDQQKNVVLRYASTDLSALPVNGKLRIPRTGTVPTQSFDFKRSDNQRATKTSPAGVNITDDYTAMAWIKVRNILRTPAQAIISAYNSTGWIFRITGGGHVNIYAQGPGGAREANSYRTVPVDEWVHVAASIDASANTAKIWINGEDVGYVISGAGTGITPAGPLMLGNWGLANANDAFDGQMDDIRVYNSILTTQQVIDSMNSYPASNTGMIAWFKGGSWNDASNNANHLTPAGTTNPVNNFASNPARAVEYARIKSAVYSGSYTDVTVYSGICNIPKATLGATSYSTADNPTGYPDGMEYSVLPKMRVFSGDNTLGNSTPSYSSGANRMFLRGGNLQDGYGLKVNTALNQIEIGPGIKRVRTSFSAMFSGVTSQYLYIRVAKNNDDIDQALTPQGAGFAGMASNTEYIDVKEGDFLTYIVDVTGTIRADWSVVTIEALR